MYYIFLISFGTTKIFKFHVHYSNFHSFKEIVMITQTYHFISNYIPQIIDNTLNSNLSFPILKYTELDQSKLKWTKLAKVD